MLYQQHLNLESKSCLRTTLCACSPWNRCKSIPARRWSQDLPASQAQIMLRRWLKKIHGGQGIPWVDVDMPFCSDLIQVLTQFLAIFHHYLDCVLDNVQCQNMQKRCFYKLDQESKQPQYNSLKRKFSCKLLHNLDFLNRLPNSKMCKSKVQVLS